jgi:16S rRNA (guanine527-N7)-methyltransferase
VSDLSRRLADRARAAGVVLDDVQLSALERYLELLARWNATINLTALPLDGFPDTTLDRLIGEPLMASRFLPAVRSRVDADTGQGGLSLFDLGTGGGSPALPLKIIRPDLRLTMVESRDRKSAFLREAIRALELRNATAITGRLEEMNAVNVDTITVRAVIGNDVLASAVRRMLALDGRLLVFGSAQPHLSGMKIEVEAPLVAPDDRLFVMRRSTFQTSP